MISNSILLKKFKLRSKNSSCSYYRLFSEKILNEKEYDLIEEVRINRNLIHYNAYESSLISEEDINDLVKKAKSIISNLKKSYEEL